MSVKHRKPYIPERRAPLPPGGPTHETEDLDLRRFEAKAMREERGEESIGMPRPHRQTCVVVGGTHSWRNVVIPPGSVYHGTWRW